MIYHRHSGCRRAARMAQQPLHHSRRNSADDEGADDCCKSTCLPLHTLRTAWVLELSLVVACIYH